MKDELYINGKDAYETWGVSLEDGAVSALMTPPTMKDFVSNTSRLEHGKRIVALNPKYDSRELTLEMHLCAKTKSDFLTKYGKFCDEVLATGVVHIQTVHQPNVTYHCTYNSCTQFSAFLSGIAKFSLKLTEPNPANRTDTSDSIKEVVS